MSCEEARSVAYICDGRACGYPPPPSCGTLCDRTTDISHAANFRPLPDGKWYEVAVDGYSERERKDMEWK